MQYQTSKNPIEEVWQPIREFLGGAGKYADQLITPLQFLVCIPNAFSFHILRKVTGCRATFSDGECENVRAANFRELSWNGADL